MKASLKKKQRRAYAAYVKARDLTWEIHDRLVEEFGPFFVVTEHADYMSALNTGNQCWEAYVKTTEVGNDDQD